MAVTTYHYSCSCFIFCSLIYIYVFLYFFILYSFNVGILPVFQALLNICGVGFGIGATDLREQQLINGLS